MTVDAVWGLRDADRMEIRNTPLDTIELGTKKRIWEKKFSVQDFFLAIRAAEFVQAAHDFGNIELTFFTPIF